MAIWLNIENIDGIKIKTIIVKKLMKNMKTPRKTPCGAEEGRKKISESTPRNFKVMFLSVR